MYHGNTRNGTTFLAHIHDCIGRAITFNKWYAVVLYEQKCTSYLKTTVLFTVKVIECLYNRGFQKETDAVHNAIQN